MICRRDMQKEIEELKDTIEYLKKELYFLKKPPFVIGEKVAIFDCDNDGYFHIGTVGGWEPSRFEKYGYDYYVIVGLIVHRRNNVFKYDSEKHKEKK